jgi:hypothetical protein
MIEGRMRVIRSTVLAIAVGVALSRTLAAAGPAVVAGQRLEDALRVLEGLGLRLVFSSELVTHELRVKAKPRATTPREQLIEILEPHGLTAENGPGGLIRIVRQKQRSNRARAPTAPPPPTNSAAHRDDAAVYREGVTVTADERAAGGSFAGPYGALGSDGLREFGSRIADDPLRAVQSLPGVAAGDDFRSEYSVRASAYRHAGVVVDGVVAPWLQHAVLGRRDAATLTMIPADMLQDAVLMVGAYPRRDSGQIGPQLNLTLREGSRAASRVSLGVSGTMTTFAAEGPLGRSARGSWLIGARKSHVEWPVGRSDHESTVFGFSDVQSKLAYDLRPGQQVSLSLVAGLSNVERDDPTPFALLDGLNRAGMAVLAWRSVIGSHTIVTQRISSLGHAFVNRDQTEHAASRGTNGAYGYRVDLARALAGGLVDAGGQVRRVHGSREGLATTFDSSASWLERSVYASFRRAVTPGVTLATGFRLADSTIVQQQAIDRWIQVEWAAGPHWVLHGSTGIAHQFPTLEHFAASSDATQRRPEQATHADVGIGRHLSASVRWDAIVFARRERDTYSESEAVAARLENALTGSARGLEVKLARYDPAGLSGWIGYSYGIARYTDSMRAETFPADFDQRHALNMSASARLRWRMTLGSSFRSGTNFPIPGYFASRDGRLFAGDRRNQVRLPAYARLDVRARRTYPRPGRHFTIFSEIINVLNRPNVGLADGFIRPETGQAAGFVERLYPRLFTAGLRVDF